MCGIAGIFKLDGSGVETQNLLSMRDTMLHRGPDDAGIWIEENIGFAHRRLSILDLSSAGHQPFLSDDGRYVITYNGEIYNFKELRKDLGIKGFQFKTQTDTEVILKLYINEGEDFIGKLNGMFAFAIWDRKEKTLFVARDRAGVKPFYYSFSNRQFAFASEQKALLKIGVDQTLNESAMDEMMVYRYISGEHTLFKNIKKLLPGHCGTIRNDGQLQLRRWWNLGEKIKNHHRIEKPFEWFHETFNSAIKYRMVSDVKVGVLLSAGLDSSSVVKSMQINKFDSVETFNVAFRNKNHDESYLAESYCKDIGYNFNKIYLDKDELFNSVTEASYYHDEPLVHFNDPQILAISKFAKSKVSVLLSGEGADEILGGYIRYKVFEYQKAWPVLKSMASVFNKFGSNNRFQKLESYLKLKNKDLMLMANGNTIYPYDFVDVYKLFGISLLSKYRTELLEEAKTIYPNNSIRQLLYYEQHTYMQSLNDRNDRATMGASIECREPFMDYRLMEGIGSLDNNYLFTGKKNKYLLANTIGKLLPDYIQNFKKIGFSVPWTDHFVNDPLFCQTIQDLDKCDFFKLGIYSKLNIQKLKTEFLTMGMHKSLITQMVFGAIWYNTYFDRINTN
jgi:asparagine synthase (glutamine-hydrolysing)